MGRGDDKWWCQIKALFTPENSSPLVSTTLPARVERPNRVSCMCCAGMHNTHVLCTAVGLTPGLFFCKFFTTKLLSMGVPYSETVHIEN